MGNRVIFGILAKYHLPPLLFLIFIPNMGKSKCHDSREKSREEEDDEEEGNLFAFSLTSIFDVDRTQ